MAPHLAVGIDSKPITYRACLATAITSHSLTHEKFEVRVTGPSDQTHMMRHCKNSCVRT